MRKLTYRVQEVNDRFIAIAWSDDGKVLLRTRDWPSYTDARTELDALREAFAPNGVLAWFDGHYVYVNGRYVSEPRRADADS